MRGWLKSKKVWGGFIAGTVAGPWLLGKIQQVTGVGVSGVANRAGGGS